jgi:cell division protein FtsZ
MINIKMQNQNHNLKPKITVIGVGGAGNNAVNNMIHSSLEGCEFLVCNTDAQALAGNLANHRIQLGVNVTRGLGAGANPEIGRAAAEESIEDILGYLEGSNMVFVTAGMGGGTGTGAAPVIAQAAREAGILTIGVVTKPFQFEGTHRMKLAENGISEMQKHVDTLIVIPNQNLFRIANEKTTFADAFRMADEVLQSGVRGVTDLMVMPGLINLDFADVRAVMAEMGKAMMGTGYGTGDRRAVEAAEKAISNPLLDGVEIKGARGVLINVIGGNDLTLFEVDEAVNRVREEVDPDANIIFGSTFDESLNGGIRISVVATGIDVAASVARPIAVTSAGSGGDIRRPSQTARPQGGYGGYAGYEQGRPAARGASDFGGGGLPPSIMPSQASAGRPMVTASAQHQPLAQRQQQVLAGGMEQPEPAMTAEVGHAASMSYGAPAAATARKMDEQDTWTRPVTPAQSYERSVPSPAQQANRGQRVGGAFIPPRPIDPRTGAPASSGSRADLFGAEHGLQPAPSPVARAPEQQVKKAPSLFERFTLRDKEPAAAPRVEAGARMTEEGKTDAAEGDLDIPAFLRRQAN